MKIFLFLLLITASIKSFSQLNNGQWLIGGDASFSYWQAKELKSSLLQISPAAGYFFKDKFVAGLRLSVDAETHLGDEKFRFTTWAAMPFARYYFLSAENKINVFADAGYGLAWTKYKNITYPSKNTYSFHTFSFMAGPAIFLNEHTSLEFTLGYTYLSRGPIDSTVTSVLRAGVGLQVHLGRIRE